ncbi:ImmA/IrrE family metallo-endopeptidase [Cupriavidus gilardii]|uniref:ImmA/IrrE family metallo-endopeptidase n=1 Tax=Cupriavidus gilardii TaxID=82541 RepID=A0A849BPR4_9BURK|nr:ImmA/IrrE family metallo-endopeptidase [Cupriavidus gilardii]MCT9015804.1 ImmA/IrrE family metallo-endopeptidase [Cupriavidus gilardii]MCT9055448.1 ImmA/IrrE family metallo-endopeptidase [Cupriavidus gilardii]NNH12529.1 ImmA/IrrE family metallo-endopeptidase [Cupriavidus gilardii]WNG69411.1 ImmA/IrrE family metallo-endopeptidase [Cupriavidus gilardii]
MSGADIKEVARNFCRLLKVDRSTVGNFAAFLERLSVFNICLDPVDDEEWLCFTEAACDPTTFRIMLPNSTYEKACKGDHAAISTIFHEIGHLVLGHRPVLHKSSGNPVREEDAEWQADEFATYVCNHMGLVPWQLCFDFSATRKRKRSRTLARS